MTDRQIAFKTMAELAESAAISPRYNRRPKSLTYFKLPEETRQKLAALKSDDLAALKPELWMTSGQD